MAHEKYSVEAAWQKLTANFPKNISERELWNARSAFYAGVITLRYIMENIVEDGLTEETGGQIAASLHAEIVAYNIEAKNMLLKLHSQTDETTH